MDSNGGIGRRDVPTPRSPDLDRLEVFRSTVEVMLTDGVLTREEKRLAIRLATALKLKEEQPAQAYAAVENGEPLPEGDPIDHDEQREAYGKVAAVALLNASLSRDEFRVLEHLRDVMGITPEEHADFLGQAEEMARLRLSDPKAIERVLETITDLSTIVFSRRDRV
jgi:hypothetical protein